MKESYTPYNKAFEGYQDGDIESLADKLVGTKNKDLPLKLLSVPAKYILKIPLKLLRVLIAADAVAHATTQPVFNVLGAYKKAKAHNKFLRETSGTSMTENEFYEFVDNELYNSKADFESAKAQAENELAELEAKGVDTKTFNVKQRAEEIRNDRIDEDVRKYSETMSAKTRLAYHPKGFGGIVYNGLSKTVGNTPLFFLLPFVKIPLNFIGENINMTPVGIWRGVFGRGKLYADPKVISKNLRDKAEIGRDYITTNERTGKYVNNRADYLTKGITGTIMGAGIVAAALATAMRDDDDEGSFGLEATYNGTGDYGSNNILERKKGLRPQHFRIKLFGKWSGWIDYRDSWYGMWFAIAGKASDEIRYNRKDYNEAIDGEELFEAVLAGGMQSVLFGLDQNYVRSLREMTNIIQQEEAVGTKFKNYSVQQTAMSLRAILYPAAYSQMYNYYQAVVGGQMTKRIKAKDSWGGAVGSRLTADIPWLEDVQKPLIDNLGQPVYRPVTRIPIIPKQVLESLARSVDNEYDLRGSLSEALVAGRKVLLKELAPNVLRNRKLVYTDTNEEVDDVKIKDLFERDYATRLGEAVDKRYFSSPEGNRRFNKMTDDELRSDMSKLRSKIKQQMLSGKIKDWKGFDLK